MLRRLSSPDRGSKKQTSIKWECLNCGEVYEFDLPQYAPAPCNNCGAGEDFFSSGIK